MKSISPQKEPTYSSQPQSKSTQDQITLRTGLKGESPEACLWGASHSVSGKAYQ